MVDEVDVDMVAVDGGREPGNTSRESNYNNF